MINAYTLSQIAYVVKYADWSRSETEKLNVVIRRMFKTVLGVPQYIGTHRLLELGMHNVLDGIAEAQMIAQLERLSGTRTGRCILNLIEIQYRVAQGRKETELPEVRDAIVTEDINPHKHASRS